MSAPELWTPQPAIEQLSGQQIVKLGYNAFNLARGSGSLLDSIERYLGFVYHGQASIELLETARPKLLAASSKKYFSGSHTEIEHIDQAEANDLIRSVVNGFISNIHVYSTTRRPFLNVNLLGRNVIQGDAKWLSQERSKGEFRFAPSKPFRSSILDYGILGRTTGVADYDEMYRLGAAQILTWASPEADREEVPAIFKYFIGSILTEHLVTAPGDKEQLRADASDLFPRRHRFWPF
jgi:hypothetical protein